MPQAQAGETDRLASVIRTIQRARRSGMLVVRRSIGASQIEEGTIIFVKGSIVDAHIGQYQGKEAYNLLSQWLRCSFTFASSNPHDPPLVFSTATMPAQASPSQDGHQPAAGADGASPRLTPVAPWESDPALQQVRGSPSSVPLTAIPVHLKAPEVSLQQIERLNYPRVYRQLCLLIDGQHSIADLSRLLRRRPAEVMKMLSDLERARCIRLEQE